MCQEHWFTDEIKSRGMNQVETKTTYWNYTFQFWKTIFLEKMSSEYTRCNLNVYCNLNEKLSFGKIDITTKLLGFFEKFLLNLKECILVQLIVTSFRTEQL